ncbi:hypothetical protein [Chishuiella sp.]|uniref:hypothetical protein n=1 Tax=Chishuiella sp. TaxID=1969467 RepID=UPI0028A85FDD|nr:hypothetical protein [Chishuiella sp.]
MEEMLVNEKEEKFLNYWEQRFKTIFEDNTSWTKLFMTVNKSTFPDSVNIEVFSKRFSQDFNMQLSYKYDEVDNEYDLTIVKLN